VYAWLNNWEKYGIQGLLDKKDKKSRNTQYQQQKSDEGINREIM
jgi:hypothetical protein